MMYFCSGIQFKVNLSFLTTSLSIFEFHIKTQKSRSEDRVAFPISNKMSNFQSDLLKTELSINLFEKMGSLSISHLKCRDTLRDTMPPCEFYFKFQIFIE